MKQATVLFITEKTKFYTDLEQQLNQNNILTNRNPLFQMDVSCFEIDQPHLVVLGCRKQEVNDLTLCRELRTIYRGLIVVVSELNDKPFRILALNIGADASMTSEDGISLIAANIQALLRRFISKQPPPQLHFGELTIDKTKRDAFLGNKPINLSSIEFILFWTLANQSGCVVSREQIHKEIYNKIYNGYDRNIDLYVSRIRQKIGDNPTSPQYLKTVRGVGYQFVGITE